MFSFIQCDLWGSRTSKSAVWIRVMSVPIGERTVNNEYMLLYEPTVHCTVHWVQVLCSLYLYTVITLFCPEIQYIYIFYFSMLLWRYMVLYLCVNKKAESSKNYIRLYTLQPIQHKLKIELLTVLRPLHLDNFSKIVIKIFLKRIGSYNEWF